MQERSCCSPSLPPFPPWLILFPLHMPRRHVLSIIPCSCCSCAPFEISMIPLRALEAVCVSHQPPHQVYSLHRLMPSPLPCLLCLQRHGIIQAILQIVVLLSNSNQHWLLCHHKVAILVNLHFFVPLACHARAIFLMEKGARPMEEELIMAVLCLMLFFCGEVLIPLYQDWDFCAVG